MNRGQTYNIKYIQSLLPMIRTLHRQMMNM